MPSSLPCLTKSTGLDGHNLALFGAKWEGLIDERRAIDDATFRDDVDGC